MAAIDTDCPKCRGRLDRGFIPDQGQTLDTAKWTEGEKPTSRWYRQFDNKSKEAQLRVGGDVHGVVGATLSARATTRGVRRALAFYEVLIQHGR